ncbi:MAG: stage 0 sporulation family protein [Clostridia bacterium]|nr:stage 0 sporulation family protein [Clostridia bacterium]MBQ2315854.1 stage 0 sporulation family protein [Clostridia bacterium]
MTEVISVKFKDAGRSYYFDPAGKSFIKSQNVIVETANGLAFGSVSEANHNVDDSQVVSPLKKVIRLATEEDLKRIEDNNKKQDEAFAICEKKIAEHKLEMKLTQVEYSFDGSKITFFFTADGRIDFRELVKDLAAHFHTRIELRQIGVRDEARMLGGIGICGQPYCCKQFLNDFQPVSIKMAKEQGLSLNPTKISGSCGRLMCCLKYEQDSYEHLISITPGIGATVKTENGVGIVSDVNLITGNLIVRPKEEDGIPFKTHRSKVKILSRGKRSKQQDDEATEEK